MTTPIFFLNRSGTARRASTQLRPELRAPCINRYRQSPIALFNSFFEFQRLYDSFKGKGPLTHGFFFSLSEFSQIIIVFKQFLNIYRIHFGLIVFDITQEVFL